MLAGAAIALASPSAHALSFTLDTDPFSLFGGIGFGAEDPFGVVAGPPGLAPSPSTLPFGPFGGGIIFSPGPGVQHPGPNGDFMDSLSRNHAGEVTGDLLFSVDRVSVGAPGSGVSGEALASQQPADIYAASPLAIPPAAFVGGLMPGFNGPLPSAGGGSGTNMLAIDDSALGLLCGLAPCPPAGIPAPPIGPGSHDNIDGFDLKTFDGDGDGVFDRDGYFTIYPDEAILVAASAADIFSVASGDFGAIAVPYAAAPALGLDSFGFNTDSIDGLLMFDLGALPVPVPVGGPGAVGPGDYALFSLAPGSLSLTLGISPADILFTDFSGSFGIYAFAADIGLLRTDNIDALDLNVPIPEPATLTLFGLGLTGIGFARRRRKPAD